MDVLRTQDLWIEKNTADGPLPVLRGITLEIPSGRVTVLLGESGAGKTILARALSGLLPEGFFVSRGRIGYGRRPQNILCPAKRRGQLEPRPDHRPTDP
jgi:peptide/nickel transport system ATP-binding protein